MSKGGSIFPFWTTEPSFSNSAGTIKFGGGLPPPAYSGTAGHIFKITFKAKKSGKAQVRFVSGAVLANDGKGTNILASMGSGSYIISPKITSPKSSGGDKKIEEKKEIEYDYNLPKILSPTHPDQNKWYNKKLAKFNWKLPDNIIGVSIGFDNDPTTDPGPKSDGLFNEKEYKADADGIWYLHLKFKDNKKWGSIENYKIMVDTESPLPFEIKIKPLKIMLNGKRKADCDVNIVVEGMSNFNDYQKIILFSGDGDFLPFLRFLIDKGKNVQVYSFEKSTAREIKEYMKGRWNNLEVEHYKNKIKFK